MLDDLKYIHDRDKHDALGIAEKQWQQLEYQFELDLQAGDIHNIVFAGMGGSALAGLISTSWPGHSVPFEIVRGYDIPKYVSAQTLFIASSYSGNTEETVNCLNQAINQQAVVVVIASGGKLLDIAKEKSLPYLVLPSVGQPRFGVFYSLKALVTILTQAGLVAQDEAEASLHSAAEFLKQEFNSWLPTVPTTNNPAKKLALECIGKSPVIYAGTKLFPAAYKWKINFNENAKNVAWCNVLPEFNHNEFLGWTSHPTDKPYAVIELRSSLEHPRIQKRFEVTERLLSGRRPAPNIVDVRGETILEQLVWAVAFGDFVSLYTALLNQQDPSNIDLMEKFKTSLDD
jgi:glucose/mannose-6-phosphate isomerase